MPQGKSRPTGGKAKKVKSQGAKRKSVGQNGKSKGTTLPKNKLRDEAGKFYTRDQRDKLTVLRNAPNLKPLLSGMKKKHMKKPLVRGRKRKAQRRAKGTK